MWKIIFTPDCNVFYSSGHRVVVGFGEGGMNNTSITSIPLVWDSSSGKLYQGFKHLYVGMVCQ